MVDPSVVAVFVAPEVCHMVYLLYQIVGHVHQLVDLGEVKCQIQMVFHQV